MATIFVSKRIFLQTCEGICLHWLGTFRNFAKVNKPERSVCLFAVRFVMICLGYSPAFSSLTIGVLNCSQTNNSAHKSDLTPGHEFLFTAQIFTARVFEDV